MTVKYSKNQLNQTGIYAIVNRETGKRYIGSTVNFRKRWNGHKQNLRTNKHHSQQLQDAWNKYSESAFDFVILEFVDPKYCIQREQWWMDLFGAYLPEHGYNVCPKADSPLGVVRSAETKRKLSKLQAGENNNFWGKSHSEEALQKIGAAHKGKDVSKETRQKLREYQCKYIYTLTAPDGTTYETISLRQFAKDNNLDPSGLLNVLKGNYRQHRGWYSVTRRAI